MGRRAYPGAMTIEIRRSKERGYANHGWLRSFHTFSFADYYDPEHMGFRALRVINDDEVDPGQGFPTHPHANMEIITYVLDGALQHRDSLGNGSVMRPGDVQRMTAGTGIRHSEFNASKDELVRLLQIWILPGQKNLEPSYEQTHYPADEKRGKLKLVASPDGREGSVTVHQDVALYATLLAAGDRVRHELAPGRHAWVQVANGSVELDGERLEKGDAAAVSGQGALELIGKDAAEVLLFDLA
jgi:quercetin 2,3-dioxygenase